MSFKKNQDGQLLSPVNGKPLREVTARSQTFLRDPQHNYFREDGTQVHDPTDSRNPLGGQPLDAKPKKKRAAKKKAAKK